jgi:release factor glutamine methyltransferase
MTTVAPDPRHTPVPGIRPHHRVFRFPGVYPVQRDTWLLADVLRRELADHGCGADRPCRVLELGAGAGALSVVAAGVTDTDVTAVDLSRRALLSTRVNATRHGRRVRTRRGDLTAPVAGERFDVVVSNPPYVPAATDDLPEHGLARAFDGGRDGRLVLDRVCAEAPRVLEPGGRLLVVHSAFNDPAVTIARLREQGMAAEVVARHEHPFGPVLTARRALLRERGLVADDQTTEELVVVRAVRPVDPHHPES